MEDNPKIKERLDKEHHTKVFFHHYKKLIDWNLATKNKQDYMKVLAHVAKITDMKKVDFNTNMLIIYQKNFSKEIFLHGMAKLPTLRSHAFLNVYELVDIAYGLRKDEFSYRDDSDNYSSEMNILEDVLCMVANCWEVNRSRSENAPGYAGELAVNSIMRRYEYSEKNEDKPLKLSWLFFKGTRLEVSGKYPAIMSFFEEMSSTNPLFKIYDLNSVNNNTSGNSSVYKDKSSFDGDFGCS